MGIWKFKPLKYLDPSGLFPEHCRLVNTKENYERCVLKFYNLRGSAGSTGTDGLKLEQKRFDAITNREGCWYGPVQYRGQGYLEGVQFFSRSGKNWPSENTWGGEYVYDFASWQSGYFKFEGGGSQIDALSDNLGVVEYAGYITGFYSALDDSLSQYSGWTNIIFGGVSVNPPGATGASIGASLSIFESEADHMFYGMTFAVGAAAGIDVREIYDFGFWKVYYTQESSKSYLDDYGRVKILRIKELEADIDRGKNSPWLLPNSSETIVVIKNASRGMRDLAKISARNMAKVYEELREENGEEVYLQ